MNGAGSIAAMRRPRAKAHARRLDDDAACDATQALRLVEREPWQRAAWRRRAGRELRASEQDAARYLGRPRCRTPNARD